MKLIILKGLPGTGKTAVAHGLENRLSNSEVIHLDDFGIKTGKNIEENFKKILKKLSKLIEQDTEVVIVEGLTKDVDFWSRLETFAEENKLTLISFMLEQPLDRLLERKPKNSVEDFKKLQKYLEVSDEIIIRDNDIDGSVNFILNKI
jgi:uridine kinase